MRLIPITTCRPSDKGEGIYSLTPIRIYLSPLSAYTPHSYQNGRGAQTWPKKRSPLNEVLQNGKSS